MVMYSLSGRFRPIRAYAHLYGDGMSTELTRNIGAGIPSAPRSRGRRRVKMQIRPFLVGLIVLATVGSACGTANDSAGAESASGVVVAVDGDLTVINSFSVLLSDGSTLLLVPADGLLFDGSSPLSHVRDHLVSGAPVRVEYHTAGGALVATAVGDAE